MTDKRPRGRPKATQEPVRDAYKIQSLRSALGLPDALITYRAIADEMTKRTGVKITHGTIHRLANGQQPQNNELRAKLGLPKLGLITLCKCGEAHPAKSCPKDRKPSKRRNYKRALTGALATLWGEKK